MLSVRVYAQVIFPQGKLLSLGQKCYFNTRAHNNCKLTKPNLLKRIIKAHSNIIQEYTKVLGCDEQLVVDLVSKDTTLLTHSRAPDHPTAMMTLLLSHGYRAEDICKYPYLFRRSLHLLQNRLTLMEKYKMWGLSIVSRQEIYFQKEFVKHKDSEQLQGSRFEILSSLLDVTPDEMYDMMKNSMALRQKPLHSVVDYINKLKKHGFTEDNIKNDLSLVNRNITEAINRIQIIEENKIPDFSKFAAKFLNCHRNVFERTVENYIVDSQTLSGVQNDVVAYLTFRLGCDEDHALNMYRRISGVRNRPLYIKGIVDLFLHDFNLPVDVLLRQTTLFNYSQKRHEQRFNILTKLGVTDTDNVVSGLILSDHQFKERYMLKLKDESS